MKIFIKITFWFFLLGGICLIVLPIPWFPKFYDVRYQGWSMIIAALIIHLFSFLPKEQANAPRASEKNKAAKLLQLLVTIALLANGLGDLGLYALYQYGFPYSYMLHVVITFTCAIFLTKIISLYYGLKTWQSAFLAFLLTMLCGISWEIFENGSDFLLHTHLAGPDQLAIYNSTGINLIQDLVGSSMGMLLMEIRALIIKK